MTNCETKTQIINAIKQRLLNLSTKRKGFNTSYEWAGKIIRSHEAFKKVTSYNTTGSLTVKQYYECLKKAKNNELQNIKQLSKYTLPVAV